MRQKYILACITLAVMIGGCSSKPEVSDVEPGLKDFWAKCNLVKPSNFKKTNGIEQGNKYQMAISYKLEIVKDLAEEDIWTTKVPKEVSLDFNERMNLGHIEIIKREEELNAPRSAAFERVEKFYAANCPAPQARHFQNIFGKDKESGFGRALKKGESTDVHTEFTMIKSEKGWIIQ